jgi:hypothetical protein
MTISASERAFIIKVVGQFVTDECNLLHRQIERLEKRISELESRGYKGVYQRALSYRKNDMVTAFDKSWVCILDCGPNEIPSKSSHWQLFMKPESQQGTAA